MYMMCTSIYTHISITATLWEVTVKAIDQISDVSHKKSLPVYHRLFNTLKSLREFYYLDGSGVSAEILDSEEYFVGQQLIPYR